MEGFIRFTFLDRVRMDDSGQLVFLAPCCRDVVLFDFEANVGDRWFLENCTEAAAPPIPVTLVEKGVKVSVPAGTFTGCYRFLWAWADYLICPGVGLVAVEDTIGTMSRELVSFDLKPPGPPVPCACGNLIVNRSFESVCCFWLQGWTAVNPDLASGAYEAPPAGGCWSLRLTGDWAPTTAIVRQRIGGVANGDVVRLSATMRAEGPGGGGTMALLVGGDPWTAIGKRKSTIDTRWVIQTIQDTLSIGPGDSVWVELSAFDTEIAPTSGLFDSVVLERLNR
jgi:hypothetical protein